MMRTIVALGVGLALPAAVFITVVHMAAPHLPAEVWISHVEGSGVAKVLSFQEFRMLPMALREAILVAIDTGFASVDADAAIAQAVQELGATDQASLVVMVNGAAVMLTVIAETTALDKAAGLVASARDAAAGAWERWT